MVAAAAVAVSEDVPVPGGTAALARTLGLDTTPDHARFVAELTRAVDGRQTTDSSAPHVLLSAVLQPLAQQPSSELVPVPLTAALWSDAVFHRKVASHDLLFAILGDRRAALVCHALAALDDETLAYFTTHPAVLTTLYERHAAAFGAFGDSLRVKGDRVLTPGGEAAVPLWEGVVGEPVSTADRFMTALFTLGEGRTAYLYETVAQAGDDHARFALGLWMPDPATRLERMVALSAAWSAAFRDWRVKTQPFARQTNDASAALLRVRVDRDGAPATPRSRAFWSRAFANADPEQGRETLTSPPDDRPIDAAWIIDATVVADLHQRADRFDELTFGQRVFGSVTDASLPDVLLAVRAVPRYRMLLWTLERMGLTRAATYAAASRQAGRVSVLDPARSFVAIAQFQGVLAVLHRMARVGTLDAGASDRLVAGLASVPLNEDGRYGGALVQWFDRVVRPILAPGDSFERALIASLSGPPPTAARPARHVRWEGADYVFDLAGAERRRLERVRERQGSVSIDVALDLRGIAQTLGGSPVRLDHVTAAVDSLRASIDAIPAPAREVEREGLPPGVEPRPDVRAAVHTALDELEKMARTKDLTRAGRIGADLVADADEIAAEALVSLAYALDVGNPDSPVFLAGDVSRRHDFGFRGTVSEGRLRAPWTLPRQDVAPGLAWHVDGSLLGLDVALARLGLRRLGMELPIEAPTLSSNQRETFIVSAALLDAYALDDATRDAIVDAVASGRQRVQRLVGHPEDVVEIGEAIGMDGWRRRAAGWVVAHEPAHLEALFSQAELLALGGISPRIDLQPWGMSAIATAGCLCVELVPPG